MRILPVLILLHFTATVFAQSKTFRLTDTTFEEDAVYIPDISFNSFFRSKIASSSYKTLDSIGAFLKQHPSVKVEVGSHGDERDADCYCLPVTQKRAEAIVHYLSNKGIAADRMIPRGYEHSQPIITDEEIEKLSDSREIEQAYDTNNRIEIKILEK